MSAAATVPGMATAGPFTFGLDLSHHNGVVDLARAQREGVSYVLLKATEGVGFVDSMFARNLTAARNISMLAVAYHYLRSNASATAQVAQVVKVVPKSVPLIPDVEADSGGIGLVREFVTRARAAGYVVPLLYLPRWYWQQIGSPDLRGLPPLWSSRYPDNIAGTIGDEFEDVPASHWQGYGGLPVALLQFTSSAIGSWRGKLDANVFRGTKAQLIALLTGKRGVDEEDELDATEKRMLRELHAVWRKGNPPGVKQSAGEYTMYLREILLTGRKFAGQLAGLVNAQNQLAETGKVDMAAVTAAAEKGAQEGAERAVEEALAELAAANTEEAQV
jgi:hypothetical protein